MIKPGQDFRPGFMRKKPEYGLGRCRYQGRNVVANAPGGTLAACGGDEA